ncbi:kelch domain-containing protein 4-like isoform X1 [Dreissena polymorpha]|uniref:kelch domain-containing protein 4-like isoform X1 n=1 Tax=Dreissena polymorpha TaxID=45954 RepID=UPI002263C7F1|nr:kelch domain-containing protein 4-like isoform X1 [Dreissena polymorpha]
MGKKNKKEKKGQGKEKTLQKTEKKANKRAKKELAEKGEDDIEKMIAQFQEQDRKKTTVTEEKCPPPSPRCNMSLTSHPDKEELIIFGGEYFTGNKMFMYNDLFFYNIKKNDWLKLTVPNSPPPRSAHQAVAVRQGGGQLWMFGGEFASPTQSQFYHYKDLWVFHLKEKTWERVNAPGGPSARSGHRMVQCKKQLIVFGGFHDNVRDYKYFNDVFTFALDTYTWSQVVATGNAPAPRSGCCLAPILEQGRVLVYGGYSKERVKKDVDEGKYHSDMFVLVPEGKVKEDSHPTKWKWVSVKQSGSRPSPRSGFTLAIVGGNKAVCFGGVFDEEENDEQLQGRFYNNLYFLELDKGRWYDAQFRGKKTSVEKKKRRRKKEEGGDDDDDNDEEEDEEETSVEGEGTMDLDAEDIQKLALDGGEEGARGDGEGLGKPSLPGNASGMEEEVGESDRGPGGAKDSSASMQTEESVFKVTIGPQSSGSAVEGEDSGACAMEGGQEAEVFMPSPRMNAMLAVRGGQLFLYGGVFEDGDRQYTLADMYSLNMDRMDEWNTIIEGSLKDQVWEESDSSSDDNDEMESGARKRRASDNEDEDEDDDDDEIDIDFSDAPERPTSESIKDYFERTKSYWTSKAKEYCDAEEMTLTDKKLEKLAKEMCQESFGS